MATLSTYALTDVASVKETLGITGTSKDNLIIRKINQATDIIESFCNLPLDHHFKQATYTNEVYNGSGTDQLVFRMRPVTTVSSFQYLNGPESNGSWDTVDTQNYFTDSQAGLINGLLTQNSGYGSYRVTYTAGYATIPYDLAEACVTLAAYLTDNATAGSNLKSKSEGQRKTEYFEGQSSSNSLVESLGLDDTLRRYVIWAV